MPNQPLENGPELPEKVPTREETQALPVNSIAGDSHQRTEEVVDGITAREYFSLLRQKFEDPQSCVLDSEVHAFLRFLIHAEQEKDRREASSYSLDTLNADSIDAWEEGKRDFTTHLLDEAASADATWAQGIDSEKLLEFQQKALLHLSRRLRKIGDNSGALVAIGRRKSILEHTPNREKDAAMIAWEMAVLRRDSMNDFPGARKDFDDAVQLAKKGGDVVGAAYDEFNLRQMETVEARTAKTNGKSIDEELIKATFDAIESLRELFTRVGQAEPRRVSALLPNMISELVETQILLGNREFALEILENLKQQERVQKSLAESGETVWKKVVADLEQRIGEIG